VSRATRGVLLIPSEVDVDIADQLIKVKGAKGILKYAMHPYVDIRKEGQSLRFLPKNFATAVALSGTARAHLLNMFNGVSKGYERKLLLVGVGYKAQVQGKSLNLQVGFSHSIQFPIPQGINIDAPSPTEVVVRGIDKQLVNQVAAQIRAYRPPEPYKGKGVRYADEVIIQKEGKKK